MLALPPAVRLGCATLFLALSASGCCCGGPGPRTFVAPPPCPTVVCDAGVFRFPDAPPPRDGGADGADVPLPLACGEPGRVGGHCRGGTWGVCFDGAHCINEIVDPSTGAPLTIRSGFSIAQASEPDPVTGWRSPLPDDEADPADDVPLPIASGTLCTVECDPTELTDGCGSCATCNDEVGTIELLTVAQLYPADTSTGGWCRVDCEFDPATAGDCPGPTSTGLAGAHTCSPTSRTCVEGCISDNECRFRFEETREGLWVSVIDETSTARCSPITHRCEWTRAGDESVGLPCVDRTDCTEHVGTCLGGTCAELECGRAADTDPVTLRCDAGRGVCLENGGNAATICVADCEAPDDCRAGSGCAFFEVAGAPSRGICVPRCDTRADDPDGGGPLTAADDPRIECRTEQACDQAAPTEDTPDPDGTCRNPCTSDAECENDGDVCELVPGETFGFCRWRDRVCTYTRLSADCHGGQVCDLLAWEGNLGLCVEPCSVVGCPVDMVCVRESSGVRRDVCRRPCTTDLGSPLCPEGQICQGTARDGHFCDQMTTTE